MRVTVLSPTLKQPVERTVSHLHHSDSYDVSLAPLPNNAVMLTVTIRNVAEHMGTRYRCVQHRDEGTIVSEELVITGELSWARMHGLTNLMPYPPPPIHMATVKSGFETCIVACLLAG